MNLRVMTDSSINSCDVKKASLLPHLGLLLTCFRVFLLPSAFLLVFPLGSLLLVCLSFAWDECSYSVSVHPQQVWLIHIIVNEQLLNAPALGTTICGRTRGTQQHDWQQNPRPEEPPPAPQVRKVLVIVDIEQVRPLMNKTHDDSMAATTCEVLPRLTPVEERALFTFNILLNTHRLETFTVYNLLYCISQHIWYTWDRFLSPSAMDIRWQDDIGDTFVLRNEEYLVTYLNAYRSHWTEGQEHSEFFSHHIHSFTSHIQPYIMRPELP